MCEKYKILLIIFTINGSSSIDLNLRDCTTQKTEECPENSQCVSVDGTFKCICLPNFLHNKTSAALGKIETYCQLRNVSVSSPSVDKESKVMIYIRSPAKTEHLVFAIFLILLSVILVVTIVYVVKLFKPLKRTKVAYVKLKRRRNKHSCLVEEEDGDIYDGIPMARRSGDALYY